MIFGVRIDEVRKKAVSINTVDAFQGQERDIIIISLVRSNAHGNIGFLHELRRMNVAMTRARYKLVIIGDSRTMCRHPFYKALYAYIDNMNGIVVPQGTQEQDPPQGQEQYPSREQ